MKVILKDLVASFILILFVVAVLSLLFNVLPEVIRMPATWEFIGVAALPLTAMLAITEDK